MKKLIFAWGVSLLVVICVWQLVIMSGFVSPATLARPLEVAEVMPSLLAPTGNLPDIISTLYRSIEAFFLSVPLGILIGLVVFFGGPSRGPSQFVLDFLRSVPATALVPVFLILYGVGDTTKVAVGTFSSALVIALATILGLENRNLTRLGIARLCGLTGLRRLILLDIPEAAPQIFLGLRAGISLALILVVVSEMLIGSDRGLGRVIYDMRYTDDIPRLYAALIVAGIIGWLYNWVLQRIERYLIRWRGKE